MARKNNKITISDMYCTKCGRRGISIPRPDGKSREPGHLKKMRCFNCQEERNFCEIRPYGSYTYQDFLFEYENNNFDEEGNRIHTYGELKNIVYKEVKNG